MVIKYVSLEIRSQVKAPVPLNKGLNIIIGANGSGKTSVLQAIAAAAGGYPLILPESSELTIGYDVESIANRKFKIRNGVITDTVFTTNSALHEPLKITSLPKVLDKLSLVPQDILYFSSSLTTESKIPRINLATKRGIRKAGELILNEIFSHQGGQVSLDAKLAEAELPPLTGVIDGELTFGGIPLLRWSSGTRNLLLMTCLIHTAKANTLILIDEPELSLHPKYQQQLMQLLKEEAATKDIVITTHSHILVTGVVSDNVTALGEFTDYEDTYSASDIMVRTFGYMPALPAKINRIRVLTSKLEQNTISNEETAELLEFKDEVVEGTEAYELLAWINSDWF